MSDTALRIANCELRIDGKRSMAGGFAAVQSARSLPAWAGNPQPAIRNGRPAFTLIEILATLVLVAIILPVAMSGISLALSVADESRRQTEAASLAQNKMAEIIACELWQTASLAGDFSPEWPEYRWAALVTQWQGTQLRQLDVQVLWNHRGKDRGVTLTTLVYTGNSG
jgi:prepilin-type N-terminal cleavage/methylation domain-containing protein